MFDHVDLKSTHDFCFRITWIDKKYFDLALTKTQMYRLGFRECVHCRFINFCRILFQKRFFITKYMNKHQHKVSSVSKARRNILSILFIL